jgi:hypothetical protein
MEQGKRLSNYAVKSQRPEVGWLHYEVSDGIVRAYLRTEDGKELLSLDRARLAACRGTKGALIEGIEYRKKGRKHSIAERQAWWCEAPPRTKPLLDKHAVILAASELWQQQIDAGWGRD